MSDSSERPRVLVIDDEMGPRESLRMLLKPSYDVFTADNVDAGLQLLQEKNPDVVVSDIRMPGTTGIEGLRKIREIDPHVSVIMLTGFGALDTAKEALRLGANDYISKPFDAREMRDVIAKYIERTRLHRSSDRTADDLKELNARLMKEVAQKERLASLGQASAEIVHDLGNPLSIVLGYVQLLSKRLEKNGGTGEASANELSIIEQNVRLCRELLTMWQSYGSDEGMHARPISVSEIVSDVVKGARSIADQSQVQFSSEITDDPCTLLGNPVQVHRAIQNVVVNAIQAAADTRGSVSVSCTSKDFYVDVRVADTGSGISSEQMSRIFDPYFTTKQSKSGTGLGLYITKKVVEDHNGSIKVDSMAGQGTTMTIRLPFSKESL
jgi:signal transduction histidine kinase